MRREKLGFILCFMLGLFVLVYVVYRTEIYHDGRTALLQRTFTTGINSPIETSLFDIETEDARLFNDTGTVAEQNVEIDSLKSPLIQNTTREFEGGKARMKYLMLYNPSARSGQRVNLSFKGCEYSACAVTLDPAKADLIIFDGVNMENVIPPKTRPPGQIWMMQTREAPTAGRFPYLRRLGLLNQFNWTYTVLNDSTFQVHYGILTERPEKLRKDYDKIYRSKMYDAAWYVSHCNTSSQREKYVRRMLPYLTIHIYGRCGDRECGSKGPVRYGSNNHCFDLLSKRYKFYLSFENSLCRDYVTEKFFNMYNNVDVVPVVRGGADYHRHYPSETFINSADFSSPEDLAKYLKALSRDKKRYLAILSKKNRYMPTKIPNLKCSWCKAVQLKQPANVYPGDILDWYNRTGNCWDPKDL